VSITNRTNWDPEQIGNLTLGQVSVYFKYWIKELKPKEKDTGFTDTTMFGLTAGIKRIPKPRKA
jgi:hypothetical protein